MLSGKAATNASPRGCGQQHNSRLQACTLDPNFTQHSALQRLQGLRVSDVVFQRCSILTSAEKKIVTKFDGSETDGSSTSEVLYGPGPVWRRGEGGAGSGLSLTKR